MKKIVTAALSAISLFVLSISIFAPLPTAAADEPILVHVFGREDCHFCQAERAFLEEEGIQYDFLDVVQDEYAAELFARVVEKHNISKVTPVTVIGSTVLQGFNSPATTGERIKKAIEVAKDGDIISLDDHLDFAPSQSVTAASGCDESGTECAGAGEEYVFELPVIGLVDLRTFSLFSLSAILGTVDGFNPCAMWVLVTFLVLLSQAGSRKKMAFLAGVFVIAEAVMYNLILNVWYKTWDFVSLDQIVTPLVGFLALGGGLFFVWRWYRNRGLALVCDISDIETQSKTISKFKLIVEQPITLMTLLALITIAFSVNIIEFACSIGIPQAYTKILELNSLGFWPRQFYLFIYTFGYMLDDIVVFGLAIWGYTKLEAYGHKYSQLSLLIGGVLMLLLGSLLVFDPNALVL